MKEYILWLQQAFARKKKEKKISSGENMLFRRKTDETIWTPLPPPLFYENPPPFN